MGCEGNTRVSEFYVNLRPENRQAPQVRVGRRVASRGERRTNNEERAAEFGESSAGSLEVHNGAHRPLVEHRVEALARVDTVGAVVAAHRVHVVLYTRAAQLSCYFELLLCNYGHLASASARAAIGGRRGVAKPGGLLAEENSAEEQYG